MSFPLLKKIKRRLLPSEDNHLKNVVGPFTLSDSERIDSLINLARYTNLNEITGDFVECGTYKGGTAAVLSRHMGENRHLWLYDSFEGMPNTTDEDGKEAKKWIGKCSATIKDVEKVLALVDTSEDYYTVKKGWFEQTFQEELPKQVSLLHCDADWYNSVFLVLDTFYPLIPKGGCIILDDFGYWEGCREAFYDFCEKHNEKPLLERVGSTQAFWIKGKLNARN